MTASARISTRLLAVAAVAAFAAVAAQAQPMSRCASCHFANLGRVPAPERLADWQQSPHARHLVGCHECHGGDPWTYVPADAHRGVLAPEHPLSPVNGANLVRTCARCHQSTARAFNSTLHQTLIDSGDRRAPSCATCHGAMSADVPSPAALEARCAECHPEGSARSAYPGLMRAGVESLNAARARADALGDAVARVEDHDRRVELLVALYNARTTLKESMAQVHAFDLQQLTERIAAATRQLDAVASAIAAPARKTDR